jgi:RIO-like serine/threonine protein kinase
LKQAFFKGRADISWVMGWTLDLLGLPTPKPVALFRGPDGREALVYPYVESTPLSQLMETQPHNAKEAAARAKLWLDALHREGVWHGDTKAQNALIDSGDEIWWIDLDAAGYSCWRGRAHRKARRDINRFEKNWQQFFPAASSEQDYS